MSSKDIERAERNDPFIALAHEVRNRLTCVHGVSQDVQRALKRLDEDVSETMQALQSQIDTARTALHLIDPAGTFEIRRDRMGDGAYGAWRRAGSRRYAHRGLDTLATPGDSVRAPMGGVVTRIGWCYSGEEYRLVEIESWPWTCKVLYVEPLGEIVGRTVHQGKIIGRAQNIVSRPGLEYGVRGMHPHLHTELRRFEELVDPTPLMGLCDA